MSQTLIEMAKDLVAEQIRVNQLSPDDANTLLLSLHNTLIRMQQTEASNAVPINPQANREGASSGERASKQEHWQRSITKHAITCLECGNTFRQLSIRHLRHHDLNPRSYRAKYGIPRSQALSARQVTARRREIARTIRPWELAQSKRETSNTPAKKRGRATPLNQRSDE